MSDMNSDIDITKKYFGIARIDQPEKRTYGWYARVRFNGKTQSKFFADIKNGGKPAALIGAIAWRNATEKKIGKIRSDKQTFQVSHNNTGVVGVCLNEKLDHYSVSWISREGKQGKTSVSIRKHGKKEAFRRACAIRKAKEAERLAGE